MPQCGIKFIFELISRAAGSGSLGAAALDDKAFNYPLKGQTTIKITSSGRLMAALCQVDDIPDGSSAWPKGGLYSRPLRILILPLPQPVQQSRNPFVDTLFPCHVAWSFSMLTSASYILDRLH